MQPWKQNLYFKLERDLQDIKEKQEELKTMLSSSINEGSELERLHIEERNLEKSIDYMSQSSYFEKEGSFDILSYAVSQIEGKKYSWREQNISFWYLYNGFLTKEECTMAYLVEEGFEEIAQLEIQSRFPFGIKETSKEQKLQCAQNYRDLSLTPSDSYIQLVFYRKDSSPKIRYRDLTLNGPLDPFGGIRSDRTSSNICDKNYSYFPVLMDKIEQSKIRNFLIYNGSISLSEKEIYYLVDEFVIKYKSSQNKESENTKKRK